MKTFDVTLEGYNSQQQALDYATGMVWGELETTEQPLFHADHVATINGVGVYYCYMADYYFYTDETEAT